MSTASVLEGSELRGRVDALLRSHAPSFWRERELADELRLDDHGIGFDSVGLVELIAACEKELGLRLPADLFLDDALTVGAFRALLAAASAAGNPR
jgi:acyl carrier protein